MLDLFLEDDIEEFCTTNDSMSDYITYLFSMPRKHIPRIQDFAEDTVPRYSTEEVRSHFRLNKATFEIILQIIAPCLTAVHEGGKEEISPEKQLLFFIWYMANHESMRETANLFDVSLSTVHKTIIRVTRTLNEVFVNVSHYIIDFD